MSWLSKTGLLRSNSSILAFTRWILPSVRIIYAWGISFLSAVAKPSGLYLSCRISALVFSRRGKVELFGRNGCRRISTRSVLPASGFPCPYSGSSRAPGRGFFHSSLFRRIDNGSVSSECSRNASYVSHSDKLRSSRRRRHLTILR